MSVRPTDEILGYALRYMELEYVIRDERVDGEMIAESLALGPYHRYAKLEDWELERAKKFAPEFDDNQWWFLRARADFLRTVHYDLPRMYEREGECVCSRELLRAAGCRCCYRSV